jgi:hypothetical protein
MMRKAKGTGKAKQSKAKKSNKHALPFLTGYSNFPPIICSKSRPRFFPSSKNGGKPQSRTYAITPTDLQEKRRHEIYVKEISVFLVPEIYFAAVTFTKKDLRRDVDRSATCGLQNLLIARADNF